MERLVIPGILTDSVTELSHKVFEVSSFAKRISIDVIDGAMANNITVLPQELVHVDWGGLRVDMQLMVQDPVSYLDQVKWAGGDRVFGHVELMIDVDYFISESEDYGLEAGLGLDLESPVSLLTAYTTQVNAVLLMSVKAGFSGQDFDIRVLQKIRELRTQGFGGDIVIDGDMNLHTIPLCLAAGANQFSVTTALWESNNPALNYRQLTGLLGA